MAPQQQSKKDPQPRLHKPSGRLVVTLTDALSGQRKDVYCGRYGDAQAMLHYARVVQA